LFSALTSKKIALFLFGALALALIPSTVSKSPLSISAGRLLLVVLAIHLSLCTLKHWRRLSGGVLLIHSGVLIILIGSFVSRAGFIATINIYEGESSDTAFRWDWQEDTPLGFTLTVNKINQAYYPVPVKVGVILADKPSKLFELKTGESFAHEGFQIEVRDLDPLTSSLHFAITSPDGVRSLQKATKESPAQHAGITLQFVAFQPPVIKRSWVELTLIPATGPPLSGKAEVNHPLQWQGLRFYHTATGNDPYGKAYAGIQVVNDPGIPLLYFGFLVVCLGNGIFLLRKRSRYSQTKHPSHARE
jgi:cytochrome c biogenesis protein